MAGIVSKLYESLKALLGLGAEGPIPVTEIRVTDADIKQLLDLYENDDDTDFFLASVANTSLTETQKDFIRRHFPRGNWLKSLIQKMVFSLPGHTVKFVDVDGRDFVQEAAEEQEPELDSETGKPKEAEERVLKATQGEEWEEWLRAKQEEKTWEGELDYWGALSFWDEMVLLTGRLACKLIGIPRDGAGEDEEGEKLVARAQRMPQLGIDYLVSSTDRKKIIAWVFTYLYSVGRGSLNKKQVKVTEAIDDKEWVKTKDDGSEPLVKNHALGFVPVSYLAWEILEGEPLGNPYGRKLAKKVLNIHSCLINIRDGSRNNSDYLTVLINAKAAEGSGFKGGAVVSVVPKVPGDQVDVKKIGGGLTMDGNFKELDYHLHELYEMAHLPFPGRDEVSIAPNSSGKALQVLSAPAVAYRNAYGRVKASFIGDMIWKMMRIEGIEIERRQVVVQVDPVQPPDSQTQDDDARFFADNGMLKEALRRKGVEEDRLDDLLAEKREQADQAMESAAFGQGLADDEEDDDMEMDPKTGKPMKKVKPEPAAE